jgi:putative nucleotidyltransferase with HDIG domain
VSLATALAVQGALPAPRGGLQVVGQAGLLMIVAFAVLYPAERATRKLAPIAMLLKLSLSFPNVTPSRFVVARRSANVGAVRHDLEAGRGDPAGNMLALVAALTAHDSRTRGHSERVRVFSEMLAQELGLDQEERERLRWAALLHDIGKLSVSAAILNKPARLDAAQWKAMHKHPDEGARLIAPIAPWLGEWASAVAEHHERLDGSGYPRGLSDSQISLGARIISVADAYDTMVTPRTYHRPISASAAREEVVRVSGMQFDPQVVRALLSLSIPRLWWRIGIGAWLAQLPLLRPRKSSQSSPGMANVVGFAAIAVTSVLVPLGALQILPPVAPGLATEQAAAPSERVRKSASDRGSRVIVVPARATDEAGEETVVLSASAPGPAVAENGGGGGPDGGTPGGADAAGNGGDGKGGGSQGGAAQGGVAEGAGDVGIAGTAVEANEDAIIVGQESPPPPPPPPPPAGPPVPPPVVVDEGPGEGGAPPHETGHDKCKGKGHGHHEHDDC